MTRQTKNIRFAFTNARSGSVDFSRPLAVISARCHGLRYLDLTFATDTLIQTKPGQRGRKERLQLQRNIGLIIFSPGVEVETFNRVFLRESLAIVKELVVHNNIQTLKLLLCDKNILQEISKLSKLTVLEIIEASVSNRGLWRNIFLIVALFSVAPRYGFGQLLPRFSEASYSGGEDQALVRCRTHQLSL